MKALDRRFVYDLQKGMGKSVIALTAYFASQGSPCKEKWQLLFHSTYIVLSSEVHILSVPFTTQAQVVKVCFEHNKDIQNFKNTLARRNDLKPFESK